MQIDAKNYNPELHDRWKALTVKQPYANDLITPAYIIDGMTYSVKSIEVRSKNTPYRGDIMICSSANPVVAGLESGVTLGIVELYDVKPITEFTPEDWRRTRIPHDKINNITRGYGWCMRNPRKVIELPIKGQLGIYNLVYTKNIIIEYPRVMVVDRGSFQQIENSYE